MSFSQLNVQITALESVSLFFPPFFKEDKYQELSQLINKLLKDKFIRPLDDKLWTAPVRQQDEDEETFNNRVWEQVETVFGLMSRYCILYMHICSHKMDPAQVYALCGARLRSMETWEGNDKGHLKRQLQFIALAIKSKAWTKFVEHIQPTCQQQQWKLISDGPPYSLNETYITQLATHIDTQVKKCSTSDWKFTESIAAVFKKWSKDASSSAAKKKVNPSPTAAGTAPALVYSSPTSTMIASSSAKKTPKPVIIKPSTETTKCAKIR